MRVVCLMSVCLMTAAVASAQPPAQAPMKITVASGLQRSYDNIKRNWTEAIAKMPEAEVNFKPTPEVRAFGQLFGHIANAQFNACSAVRGEANPNQGVDNEKKTTKAEVAKALADSFAYCDAAFSSLTDENAAQLVKQGPNEAARAAILSNVVAHDNEMYGTAAVYFRLKGIVPPSTERQMQTRRP